MRGAARAILYAAAVAAYLLHTDLWWWDDPRLVLGLPIGLTYHVLFCVAATVLMGALVRLAWPRHLATDEREPESGR